MNKQLLIFNQKGWIAGPTETEESFYKRIELLNHFFSYPPPQIDNFLTDGDWQAAQKKLQILYDFFPDWIVAYYSNRQLSFFQGAATWITKKENLSIPFIQMRKKFETGTLLGMYSKDEVLAHEAVHAARMEFEEPRFEEIFAYQTSPFFLRRFLGPLFEKSWEAYLFMVLLFFPLAIEIIRFFYFDFPLLLLISVLPLLFFSFLFFRLIFMRVILSSALKRLRGFLENPKKKWAVAMRLKDREIFLFGLSSEKKIRQFLKTEDSFRWTLLKKIYFKNN